MDPLDNALSPDEAADLSLVLADAIDHASFLTNQDDREKVERLQDLKERIDPLVSY